MEINKPKTLSVRHYIQRKLSVKLMISEDVIDEVISYSGKQFAKALKEDKTIELSGFGKLVFRDKKAKAELDKMTKIYNSYQDQLSKTTDEKKITNLTKRMNTCKEVIDFLKTKLDEQD